LAVPQKLWQASNFRIEISGLPAGYFKSVSGLSAETEVMEGRVAKVDAFTLKQKVLPSTDPFSLKAQPGSELQLKAAGRLLLQGLVLDQRNGHLIQHWLNPGTPRIPTPTGQIVMTDQSGRPVRRYNFYEAWPCKWYVPDLDGSKNLELAVGRLVRA
jgi:hypothetical protein